MSRSAFTEWHLASTFVLSAGGAQESPVNVCELLKSAKQFDGKVVVVSGFIDAAGHSEGIAADGSPRIDPFHMTLIGCLTTSFLLSQTDAFACGPSRLLSRDDSGGMFPHLLGG